MKLHLYLDHTAEIERDGVPTLEISNGDEIGGKGRLEIADEVLEIQHGGAEPKIPGKRGVFGGVFTTDGGVQYVLRAVRINSDGSLLSDVDFAGKYFILQKRLDRLLRAVEEFSYELENMKGEIIPNALGFIGVGDKQDEQEEE